MNNELPEFLSSDDMQVALKRLRHFLDEEGYGWSSRLSLLLTAMCVDAIEHTQMPTEVLTDLVKWSMTELREMDRKFFK